MRLNRLARTPVLLLTFGVCLAAFSLTFTHLAGSIGGPGFEDGNGQSARFNSATGAAVDSSGNVYIADSSNHTIRKISPGGEVTTLAGLAETSGSADGTGAAARFRNPSGVATDSAGNVYVTDSFNFTIRKITPAGAVTTLAGTAGQTGSADGTGPAARFNFSPQGVATDSGGNVYVADTSNSTIRKITPAGVVTTLAGTAGQRGSTDGTGAAARFSSPRGVATDSGGNVYVADSSNNTIRKITPAAVVTTLAGTAGQFGSVDGTGPAARFSFPGFLTTDSAGNIYVADNNTIRRITPTGLVTTLVGTAQSGSTDGTGSAARFFSPSGVAADGAGNVYVADTGNHTVRKVILAGGTVSTFAGLANESGFLNGTGSAARFSGPSGLAFYPGFAYVADTNNHAIRRVGLDGVVTTLAGGTFGYQNGNGATARFRSPTGVAVRFSDLSVFVADSGNHCIRLVDASGNATLYAGQPGVFGSVNGDRLTTASFRSPLAVALGSSALYVADTFNYLIRKIDTATGQVTTLAGSGTPGSTNANGTNASFGVITGISVDSSENVYVAESQQYFIRKITPSGDVTTLAGSCCSGPRDGNGTSASFSYPGPQSITRFDGSQPAYVADGTLIRTITTGGAVGTAGGRNGVIGTSDGTGTLARFNGALQVASLSVNPQLPNVLVISEQNRVRFGSLEIADRATIDSATGGVGNTRQLDTSPQTATSWTWSVIRRPASSTATLSAANVRNPTFTPDLADLFIFRCVAVSSSGSSISTVSVQPPLLPSGDVNGDGQVTVGDVFYLINHLFASGPAPIGPGDANADGTITVGDVFYLINFLFAAGPAPV